MLTPLAGPAVLITALAPNTLRLRHLLDAADPSADELRPASRKVSEMRFLRESERRRRISVAEDRRPSLMEIATRIRSNPNKVARAKTGEFWPCIRQQPFDQVHRLPPPRTG
ncbi:unnamed protein product [[Actinomadura] parvosata subsp. kistnae]|nr:unnamed protein product [Actinomadura parvosata subsp. kistnae]